MREGLYSCYDKKAGYYLGLFPARSDGEASRMVEDAVKNPESAIARHPGDYCLYRVAEFDVFFVEYLGARPVKRSGLVCWLP